MGRPEPVVQESANEVDEIDELLAPKTSEKICMLDHQHQLQLCHLQVLLKRGLSIS
jgi:hypothetical protein